MNMKCIYFNKRCNRRSCETFICYKHKCDIYYYNALNDWRKIEFTASYNNMDYRVKITPFDTIKLSIYNLDINEWAFKSEIIPFISPENANEIIGNIILL